MISFGQTEEESGYQKFMDKYKIKTSVGLQIWSTYTLGQEVFEDGEYVKVNDRLNTQIRRTRLSASGNPYKNISFKMTASLDLVGKDLLSATQAGANNGSSPIFRVWNAYVSWKLLNNSDALHITTGYLPPQVGRESITAALKSTSFEKSWSQNYIRRFVVGIGPGRATGINLGGLFFDENRLLNLSYDIGVFTPETFGAVSNTLGFNSSPLIAGRAVMYIGDPEAKTYTLGHGVNYFGKRKGFSLAFAGSQQDESDIFTQNNAYGIDWLLNYGPINFDGEWMNLSRSGLSGNEIGEVKSVTGYFRLGYNIHVKGNSYIEPVIMYTYFNGPKDIAKQNLANELKTFSGTDEILDVNINYHFNPKLKVSVGYTHNSGSLGEADLGSTINNYFSQTQIGGIKRGDLLGLSIVSIM